MRRIRGNHTKEIINRGQEEKARRAAFYRPVGKKYSSQGEIQFQIYTFRHHDVRKMQTTLWQADMEKNGMSKAVWQCLL